jgi:pimeloyl-ACP methyl ester carboxylesterase
LKRLSLPVAIAATLFASGVAARARQTSVPGASKPAVPAAARPAFLEGEWAGVLQVGDTQLHLVLHLFKDEQGKWHAKLDSLNQAVYGLEASDVTRAEDTLRFEIPSVGAKFQGKIEPDHRSIRGLWEQSGTGLPLKFEKRSPGAEARLAASAVSKAEGTWQGAIAISNMRMRLQMHVTHGEKGELLASVDSLDQGIEGIPASQVTETNGQLKFEMPAFQAEYAGTLSATKNEISGVWTQNDTVSKLDFVRSEKPLQLRRPQTPVKPYPYKEEAVSFRAADGSAKLAGTLTIPQGDGPFPAAVFVGGSGPTDRDESIAGHQPFLLLADLLTRKGIAVLRYDKRGIAQSTGDYARATMQDFSGDAGAALAYLKSRKEVDAKRLGILGHSEGGILAAMVATRSSDVDWVVLLATPATTGERTLLRQSELIARTGGLPEEQIARSQQFDRDVYALVREEKSPAVLEKKLNDLIEKRGLTSAMPPAALQAQVRMMTTPWFRDFLSFDPGPLFEELKCAVLALNGDRDLQVDAEDSVPLLRKAYKDSGNKDFTVAEIEGVNHWFQKALSGSPALYGAIEETMAPEVQTAISGWIGKHTAQ